MGEVVPFEDFTRSVLALYTPPIRRKRTAEKLSQALREFAPLCPTTADITPAAVAAWMAQPRARSAISSFSLLRSFAGACRAGSTLGILPADPFRFRPPARWWPDITGTRTPTLSGRPASGFTCEDT